MLQSKQEKCPLPIDLLISMTHQEQATVKPSLNPVIIIPTRLASTRLPSKALANIGGKPMILWVLERALQANIGPVFVACAEQAVADIVKGAGGQAILTDPQHPSGSDRIYEALNLIDPKKSFDVVINLQGDLPTIEPDNFDSVLKPLSNKAVDIATLVAKIESKTDPSNPNIVKAIMGLSEGEKVSRVIYFSRTLAPSGRGPFFHHIGIYAYRRKALSRFVNLPTSVLERRERLEQLRALEDGMRIDATLVDTIPIGVDTLEDLNQAKSILEKKHV